LPCNLVAQTVINGGLRLVNTDWLTSLALLFTLTIKTIFIFVFNDLLQQILAFINNIAGIFKPLFNHRNIW